MSAAINSGRVLTRIGSITGLDLGATGVTNFTLEGGATLAVFCPMFAVVSYASGTVAAATATRLVVGAAVIGGAAPLTGLASGKYCPLTVLDVPTVVTNTDAVGVEVTVLSGTAATANVVLYGVRM